MNLMPSTRAMFSYDVIGSSTNDDDKLEEIRAYAAQYVAEAFDLSGVDVAGRANYSPTGDGAISSYPESSLPSLIDAVHYLDGKLLGHNRKYVAAVRLRISIHTGPVRATDDESFQRRTIELTRSQDAAVFKKIARRIEAFRPSTVALILSDQAYRVAVLGRHTERLHPYNFGEVQVANKEFTDRCWVHVPGLDKDRIGELSQPEPSATNPSTEQSSPRYQNFQGNHVGGNNSGSMVANFGKLDQRP